MSSVAASKKCPFIAVEIEINHDCNRACPYCPNSITERKHQGRMSEPLFLKILTELKSLDFKGRVSFHFYNEPLLSPDLDRFSRLTKEYLPECRIDLYTNGTLLTAERFHELVAAGVDNFLVTRHVNSPDYVFERTFEALDEASRARVKYRSYKEMTLFNRGGLLTKIRPRGGTLPLDLPCFIPSTLVVITVNGNVLPCFEDYNERNVMGNVGKMSLMEIWSSDIYREFREALKRREREKLPVCRECSCEMILS